MELSILDISIIVGFLALSLIIGLYYRNQAGKSLIDYFLGGRNLPWYIAGISMVATTFAADTPLAVAEMVAENGISRNWLWWSFLIGGMLTTFFFSKLWRRADILTELEFIQIRYSGKEAKFLRLFKSIYLGIFMNVMIIGWVNLAFNTLLITFFNIPAQEVIFYTAGAMLVAVIYTSLSGLKGVAVTDTIQFVIAIVGTIILAVLVINSEEVGGITQLQQNLPESYFRFFPSLESNAGGETNVISTLTLSFGAFFSFVAVQWWASWYPGSEPGGGGYIAQRMMSCKTEKDAIYSTLFFQIAHYCLRPWPWILVGLAAVYLYSPEFTIDNPQLVQQINELKAQEVDLVDVGKYIPEYNADPEVKKAVDYTFNYRLGYAYAMVDFLPNGLRGLLLVAFLAAYLSTISTQLNWGASYIVNDFYLPITGKNEEQKKLVLVSRITTGVLMVIGLWVTTLIDSISGVWEFIMECGAGLGMVLILRWYWWRINAWSEIAATLAPFIGYVIGNFILAPYFGEAFVIQKGTFLFTVGFTTVIWILVTYLTAPTDDSTLVKFYKRVRPQGIWDKYQTQSPEANKNFYVLIVSWLSAVIMTYSILFATGKLLFQSWLEGFIWALVSIVSFLILRWSMKKSDETA